MCRLIEFGKLGNVQYWVNFPEACVRSKFKALGAVDVGIFWSFPALSNPFNFITDPALIAVS